MASATVVAAGLIAPWWRRIAAGVVRFFTVERNREEE
jgi:hypothetical protein